MTDHEPETTLERLYELHSDSGIVGVVAGVGRWFRYNTPILSTLLSASRKYGVRHGIPYLVAKTVFNRLPADDTGVNVLSKEWDVLIVLDTCRYEWIDERVDEYDCLNSITPIRSVGGRTSEWVSRTFEDCSDQVTYIYGSKYGDLASENGCVSTTPLDDYGTYPPAHEMTDAALDVIVEGETGRLVVHYMQPHYPVFKTNGDRTRTDVVHKRWPLPNMKDVECGYRDNLTYVLDEVEYLISELREYDLEIRLTADHGESLGEWMVFGHPPGGRHDAVRTVPWCEVSLQKQ